MKITIVLDNVRSAFNIGGIFRTCDGLGFDLVLIGITPQPGEDKKLDKTSLGAIENVKWKYFKTQEEWLQSTMQENSKIFSLEEGKFTNTKLLPQVDLSDLSDCEQLYLVFGHEINGVSDEIASKSDLILEIPMLGVKNSLNVGTCVGLVGYKFLELMGK